MNKFLPLLVCIVMPFQLFSMNNKKRKLDQIAMQESDAKKRKIIKRIRFVPQAIQDDKLEDIDLLLDTQKMDIFEAIQHNCTDRVRILIRRKSNIDQMNANGDTPLLCAIKNNNIQMVELLLSAGANPNLANYNVKPLSYAAQQGYTVIVTLLLKLKANINAIDYATHYTALHWAILNNHTETAQELLKNSKIAINIKTHQGETALDLAKQYNNQEIIDELNKREYRPMHIVKDSSFRRPLTNNMIPSAHEDITGEPIDDQGIQACLHTNMNSFNSIHIHTCTVQNKKLSVIGSYDNQKELTYVYAMLQKNLETNQITLTIDTENCTFAIHGMVE